MSPTRRRRALPARKKEEEQVKDYALIERCADDDGLAWLFQIDSAILLALSDLKNVDKVNIEGPLEDIELYESGGQIRFIQAKLKVAPGLPEDTEKSKYRSAMRAKVRDSFEGFKSTLAKIEKNGLLCSRLVFLTNALYPLGIFEDSKWEDFKCKKFEKLSGAAQAAIKELAELQEFSIENLNKFSVCVVPYERDSESENVDCPALTNNARDMLAFLIKKDWLWKRFLSELRNKGATSSVSRHFFLTKRQIIWFAVVLNMEFCVSDYSKRFEELYDEVMVENIQRQYSDIISFTEDRIDLMLNISKEYKVYESDEKNREKRFLKFSLEHTTLVKDVLPGKPDNLSEEQYESLCAYIIFNALMRADVVDNAKRNYNLV